jgi:hypothetical protein
MNNMFKFLINSFLITSMSTTILLNGQSLLEQLQLLQQQLQQLEASLKASAVAPAEDVNRLLEEKLSAIEEDLVSLQISIDPLKAAIDNFFNFNWKEKIKKKKAKQNFIGLQINAENFESVVEDIEIKTYDLGLYFDKNDISQQNKNRYIQLLSKIQKLTDNINTYIQGYKIRFSEITVFLYNFNRDNFTLVNNLFLSFAVFDRKITKANSIITELIKGNKIPLNQHYQETAASFQELSTSMKEYLQKLRNLIANLVKSEDDVKKNLYDLQAKSNDLQNKEIAFQANIEALFLYSNFITDRRLIQQWLDQLNKFKEGLFNALKNPLGYESVVYMGRKKNPAAQKNLPLKTVSGLSVEQFIDHLIDDELNLYYRKMEKELTSELPKTLHARETALMQEKR